MSEQARDSLPCGPVGVPVEEGGRPLHVRSGAAPSMPTTARKAAVMSDDTENQGPPAVSSMRKSGKDAVDADTFRLIQKAATKVFQATVGKPSPAPPSGPRTVLGTLADSTSRSTTATPPAPSTHATEKQLDSQGLAVLSLCGSDIADEVCVSPVTRSLDGEVISQEPQVDTGITDLKSIVAGISLDSESSDEVPASLDGSEGKEGAMSLQVATVDLPEDPVEATETTAEEPAPMEEPAHAEPVQEVKETQADATQEDVRAVVTATVSDIVSHVDASVAAITEEATAPETEQSPEQTTAEPVAMDTTQAPAEDVAPAEVAMDTEEQVEKDDVKTASLPFTTGRGRFMARLAHQTTPPTQYDLTNLVANGGVCAMASADGSSAENWYGQMMHSFVKATVPEGDDADPAEWISQLSGVAREQKGGFNTPQMQRGGAATPDTAQVLALVESIARIGGTSNRFAVLGEGTPSQQSCQNTPIADNVDMEVDDEATESEPEMEPEAPAGMSLQEALAFLSGEGENLHASFTHTADSPVEICLDDGGLQASHIHPAFVAVTAAASDVGVHPASCRVVQRTLQSRASQLESEWLSNCAKNCETRLYRERVAPLQTQWFRRCYQVVLKELRLRSEVQAELARRDAEHQATLAQVTADAEEEEIIANAWREQEKMQHQTALEAEESKHLGITTAMSEAHSKEISELKATHSDTVEKLQAQVKQLSAERSEWIVERRELRITAHTFQRQRTVLERELKVLRAKLTSYLQTRPERKEGMFQPPEVPKTLYDAVCGELGVTADHAHKLSERLERLYTEHEGLQATFTETSAQLQSARTQLSEMEAKLTASQGRQENMDAEMRVLQESKAALERSERRVEKQYQVIRAYKSKAEKWADGKASMKEEMCMQRMDVADSAVERSYGKLFEEWSRMYEDMNAEEQPSRPVDGESSLKEDSLKLAAVVQRDLGHVVAMLKQRLHARMASDTKLKAQRATLLKAFETLQTKYAETLKHHAAEKSTLAAYNQQTRQHARTLRDSLQKTAVALKTLTDVGQKHEASVKQLKEQVKAGKAELAAVKKDLKSTEEESASRKSRLEEAVSELKKSKQEIMSMAKMYSAQLKKQTRTVTPSKVISSESKQEPVEKPVEEPAEVPVDEPAEVPVEEVAAVEAAVEETVAVDEVVEKKTTGARRSSRRKTLAKKPAMEPARRSTRRRGKKRGRDEAENKENDQFKAAGHNKALPEMPAPSEVFTRRSKRAKTQLMSQKGKKASSLKPRKSRSVKKKQDSGLFSSFFKTNGSRTGSSFSLRLNIPKLKK